MTEPQTPNMCHLNHRLHKTIGYRFDTSQARRQCEACWSTTSARLKIQDNFEMKHVNGKPNKYLIHRLLTFVLKQSFHVIFQDF